MIGRATSLAVAAALASACTAGAPARGETSATAAPEAVDAGVADARPAVDPATCTDCHATVTAEWRASAHHAAFTNDVFQNEWLLRGDPWCVRCHAPRADADAPGGAAAAEGIGCASCHVVGGEIVSSRASGQAPHATRVDPRFTTEAACATCHTVKFPPRGMLGGARPGPNEMLQRTVAEWHRSGAAGACQSCHMPLADTPRAHRSHAFPGGRDPALLSRALHVRADARCDGGRTRVHLVLEASDVGHDVPTGDVFRRLEVRAALDGRPWTAATADLYRHFAVGTDGLLHETQDGRVPAAGAREVTLVLRGCGADVAWSVDWLALDADVAAQRALAVRDVRTPVARGVVRVGH